MTEPSALCELCHRYRNAAQMARCPMDSECCQAVAQARRLPAHRERLPAVQGEGGHASVAWPGC